MSILVRENGARINSNTLKVGYDKNNRRFDDDDFYKVVKGDLAVLSKIAKEKASQTQANKDKANEVDETDTTISEQEVVETKDKPFVNNHKDVFEDIEVATLNSFDKERLISIIANYERSALPKDFLYKSQNGHFDEYSA
ncbi:hypothetical protein KKC15_08630 [bacterium]|nr:hypothetical protein [bacterium]